MKRWNNLGQIAISVLDMEESRNFYEDVLGYAFNSRTDIAKGPIVSRLQGHKKTRTSMRWISDRSPTFQIELFGYDNPTPRPMPDDARPCDIGYRRLGIWVEDFDATLKRVKETKNVVLVSGPKKYSEGRRVCFRDPNGIFIEMMENDIINPAMGAQSVYNLPVKTRSLTLSVPDLEEAEGYFSGVLGMELADITLHTPEMEELWDLAGAKNKTKLLLWGDLLLELVQYTSPKGKPWPPDKHNGDAGLFHIALGFNSSKDLMLTYKETIKAGHSSNSKPFRTGVATAVYTRTNQDFIVEYFYFNQILKKYLGFRKLEL